MKEADWAKHAFQMLEALKRKLRIPKDRALFAKNINYYSVQIWEKISFKRKITFIFKLKKEKKGKKAIAPENA